MTVRHNSLITFWTGTDATTVQTSNEKIRSKICVISNSYVKFVEFEKKKLEFFLYIHNRYLQVDKEISVAIYAICDYGSRGVRCIPSLPLGRNIDVQLLGLNSSINHVYTRKTPKSNLRQPERYIDISNDGARVKGLQ